MKDVHVAERVRICMCSIYTRAILPGHGQFYLAIKLENMVRQTKNSGKFSNRKSKHHHATYSLDVAFRERAFILLVSGEMLSKKELENSRGWRSM